MSNKINIKLCFGEYTKQNILYIYPVNSPIAIINIHFYSMTFEYYNDSSEITLWNEDNKIICSIDRCNINIFDNEINGYNNDINTFMKG